MKIKIVSAKRLPDWPIWAVVVGLLWLSLVAIAVYLSIKTGKHVELCLLKKITHIPCPTCGVTRSCLNILKGNFLAAFLFNPLIFLAGFIFLIIATIKILFARSLKINLTKKEKKIIWVILTILFVVNWIYIIVFV